MPHYDKSIVYNFSKFAETHAFICYNKYFACAQKTYPFFDHHARAYFSRILLISTAISNLY